MTERLDRGLSRDAAAKQIGISHPTLARAEQGLPISAASMKRIADFYGVRVREIYWGPHGERDEDYAA